MPLALELLKPGHVLLYGGTGFVNRLIQAKTWSRYSHCELYDGGGYSLASRNGQGVGRYPVRLDGLLAIMSVRAPMDMDAIRNWFDTVDGQPYDWWGLLSFTSAKIQGRENFKQFCSEFLIRALRVGIGAMCEHPSAKKGDKRALEALGLDPFNGYDADGLAPSEIRKSPMLRLEFEA